MWAIQSLLPIVGGNFFTTYVIYVGGTWVLLHMLYTWFYEDLQWIIEPFRPICKWVVWYDFKHRVHYTFCYVLKTNSIIRIMSYQVEYVVCTNKIFIKIYSIQFKETFRHASNTNLTFNMHTINVWCHHTSNMLNCDNTFLELPYDIWTTLYI